MSALLPELNVDLITSFFDTLCVREIELAGAPRLDLSAVQIIELPRLTITVQGESYLEQKPGTH